MKPQSKPDRAPREPRSVAPIRCSWGGPDGTIHHLQTAIVARSKGGLRAAYKRFFQLHTV